MAFQQEEDKIIRNRDEAGLLIIALIFIVLGLTGNYLEDYFNRDFSFQVGLLSVILVIIGGYFMIRLKQRQLQEKT